MLVWRTDNPFKRAQFLWSLLQVCASRLKRAPPVQRLKLLDLQTFADDPPPSFSSSAQQQQQQPVLPKAKSKSKSSKYSQPYNNESAHIHNANKSSHAHRSRSDPHAAAAAAAVHIVDDQRRRGQNYQDLNQQQGHDHDHDREPSPASSSATSGFVRSERWHGQDGDEPQMARHAHGKSRIGGLGNDGKARVTMPSQTGRKLGSPHYARQTGSTTTVTATSVTGTTSATANSYKAAPGLQRVNSPQRDSNPPIPYDHPTNAQRVTRTLSEPKVSASMVETLVEQPAQPRTILPREQASQMGRGEVRHAGAFAGDSDNLVTKAGHEPNRIERSRSPCGNLHAGENDSHGNDQPAGAISGEESSSDNGSDGSDDERWLTRPPRRARGKGGGRTGKHKNRLLADRQQKDRAVKDRDLNIDERAFLAAAKRMGAKNLSPMCKAEVIEQFASVGSDPKSPARNRATAAAVGDVFVADGVRMGTNKRDGRASGTGGGSGAMDKAGDPTKVGSVGECNGSILDDDRMGASSGGCFGRKKKALCERNALAHLRLNKAERDDLTFSLGLFEQEVHGSTMFGEDDEALGNFGMWAERQIEALEASNVSSIVRAAEAEQHQQQQKQHQQRDEEQQNQGHKRKVTSINDAAVIGINGIAGNIKTNDPLTLLVKEVTRVEPWLSKSETLLAPYARLARDIHSEVQLLEVQRRNVSALQAELGHLVSAVTLSDAEDELLADLDCDIHDLSPHPAEANYTHVFQAVEVIAHRVHALSCPPVSRLAGMSVVKTVRDLVRERQTKASRALLPCLRRFLDVQYRVTSSLPSSSSSASPTTATTGTATNSTSSPATPSSVTASPSTVTASSPVGTAVSPSSETTATTAVTTTATTMPTTAATNSLQSPDRATSAAQSTPLRGGGANGVGDSNAQRQHDWDMTITSVDDVRLNMAEAVSSAVFSEFFKGARCLYMCCDRAFAHLIDHFVAVSARWVRAVVRYAMSTTSGKKDEDDSTVVRNNWIIPSLIDAIMYACLSEGFSTYRMFAPVLNDSLPHLSPSKTTTRSITYNISTSATTNSSSPSLCKPIATQTTNAKANGVLPHGFSLDSIIRRQVPDVSFVKEWLTINNNTGKSDDDAIAQTALFLHTAFVIEAYIAGLQREREDEQAHELDCASFPSDPSSSMSGVRVSVRDVVTRVEVRLGLQALAPPNAHVPTSLGFQYSRALFDRMCTDAKLQGKHHHGHTINTHSHGTVTTTTSGVVVHGYDVTKPRSQLFPADAKLTRVDSLSPRSKVVALVVPQLLAQSRTIMSQLVALVDAHVAQCVADLAVDHSIHDRDMDVVDPAARALYFARVRECVDLCHALASVDIDGQVAVPTSGSGDGIGRVNNNADNPNENVAQSETQTTTGDGSDMPSGVAAKTKTMCEKLIAAVMRHTEVVAANSPKPFADMLKMQAYAYVAARLSHGWNNNCNSINSSNVHTTTKSATANQTGTMPTNSYSSSSSYNSSGITPGAKRGPGRQDKDEFVMQLANLSNRVRRHVMKQWIEQNVFDSVLEGLNILSPQSSHPSSYHYTHHMKQSLSSSLRSPTQSPSQMQIETTAKLRHCISTLSATDVAAKMKSLVDACMENAMHTSAAVPIYSELVSCTKERMEHVLKHVRRDKSISDLRPSLLSFSRQLLSILRGNLRRAQHKFEQ